MTWLRLEGTSFTILSTEGRDFVLNHFTAVVVSARSQRSVFFVDEAWLFMETPSIVRLFENIAMKGRRYGVVFMFISHRAENLAGTPQGRTILEQSATTRILRQEPKGRDAVKNVYKLGDAEADFLINTPAGTGIPKARRKRLTLQVLPTEEELKVFSMSIT